ncbi:hypothetical protein C1645_816952 [Glomus cerebriforme]|uniref:Uncharacterized protein n=1 Tax=Glomus cerebriforme TaxID=658196 RepID=A0A397TAD0_9GLOM|nr:hypothetical protein C1645_816952 [Glomus cerebriforme]
MHKLKISDILMGKCKKKPKAREMQVRKVPAANHLITTICYPEGPNKGKYFIIIQQQKVEGLFNKLDLKTHPNMLLSVKQSKLRLSSNKIAKEDYTDGLKEIRAKRNVTKKIPLQEIQLQQYGSNIASNLLISYYINFKKY